MGPRRVRPERVVHLKESGGFLPQAELAEDATCRFQLQLRALGLPLPEAELINSELESERKGLS